LRLAVLSGKGGTGKTTVAVNLAVAFASAHATVYVDYDVEEPNGFIFLQPRIVGTRAVTSTYPVIGEECEPCGVCSAACTSHALAEVGGRVLVFPEICHGCGTCTLACPRGAIREKERPIGELRSGTTRDGLACYEGILREGETLATTVIRRLREFAERATGGARGPIVIADCPPGSSCEVMHAVEGSDLALLVAEPTVFGLHDLGLAVRLARHLDLPAAIFVNKDDGSGLIDNFAAQAGLPILGRLPFDLEIARVTARGTLLMDDGRYADTFSRLAASVSGLAGRSRTA
jgi:MinD superfamily P-loop ATPase